MRHSSRNIAPIHREAAREIARYGYQPAPQSNPMDDALTIGAGVAGGILAAGLVTWIVGKLTS